MAIHAATTVKDLERRGESLVATLEPGGEIAVEKVVLAVGIVGNVEGLGLEGTGVRVDRGHVEVDEFMRTGEPGVYAIGVSRWPAVARSQGESRRRALHREDRLTRTASTPSIPATSPAAPIAGPRWRASALPKRPPAKPDMT